MMPNTTNAILRINRLALDVSIGVYAHERFMRSVVVNIIAEIPGELAMPRQDALHEVVDYDQLVVCARKAVAGGQHIQLLETLCQRIANECLQLPSVQTITVQVEKGKAMAGVDSVSVEITRQRKPSTSTTIG